MALSIGGFIAVMFVVSLVLIFIFRGYSLIQRRKAIEQQARQEGESTRAPATASVLPGDIGRGNVENSVRGHLPGTTQAVIITLRRLDEGPSVPAYTSANTRPLPLREQEPVARMDAMVENRSRPPSYPGPSSTSQVTEAPAPEEAERRDENQGRAEVASGSFVHAAMASSPHSSGSGLGPQVNPTGT
ncbi:hypothetical protein L218DRAFT_1005331 [Marasmius fiardii PR-910]|nr:hypothetical protein L218DRAFT_1005331 [Marasmius fiardii PR-910]